MAERSTGRSKNGSRSRKLSAQEAAALVRHELPPLLGREVESVLGVRREDDGGWGVTVAVVELSRVPSSTDVLGAYEVDLDGRGELVGYRRRRRYTRNQADED
jgi:hypothetical protein